MRVNGTRNVSIQHILTRPATSDIIHFHKIRMLTLKKQRQRLRGRHALLAASGQVTTNPAEDLGAIHRPEATRDLLLHLGHAQIVFTLVIDEGYALHFHEAQGILLEVA